MGNGQNTTQSSCALLKSSHMQKQELTFPSSMRAPLCKSEDRWGEETNQSSNCDWKADTSITVIRQSWKWNVKEGGQMQLSLWRPTLNICMKREDEGRPSQNHNYIGESFALICLLLLSLGGMELFSPTATTLVKDILFLKVVVCSIYQLFYSIKT